MKTRFACWMMVLVLAMGCVSAAFAEDLGVQVIGGENANMEALTLEDIQLGETYEIGGYARLTPVEFKVIDAFTAFEPGSVGNANLVQKGDSKWQSLANAGLVYWGYDYWPYFYEKILWQSSGKNADFVWLQLDITNLQKQPVDFMSEMSIKVVYQDEYEYQGWVRQLNYDYDLTRSTGGGDKRDYGPADYGTLIRAAISPDDAEPVDMVYTGHYVIGCTLPNAVIEDKKAPLSIIVNLGENEITYNIRK